jgi:hypothetical protein
VFERLSSEIRVRGPGEFIYGFREDIPNSMELTEALWRLGGEPHVLSVVDW